MLLLVLLSFVCAVLGLQSDLAGVADWHTALIGTPVLNPSPPTFVLLDQGYATLLATDEEMVAVLNDDGSVRWRQKVDDLLSFKVHGDAVVVLSGPLGTTARLFDLSTGKLRWIASTGDETAKLDVALPPNARGLGTDVVSYGDDVIVLSEGRRVTRINGTDGSVPWSWEFPGSGATNLFKQLMISGDEVNVLGIMYGLSEPTMAHITFNADTIMPLSELSHIPSGLGDPTNAYLMRPRTVGGEEPTESGVRGVWAQSSRFRSVALYNDGTASRTSDHIAGTGRRYEHIIDVGLRDHGYMIGVLQSGAALVVAMGDMGNAVAEFDRSRETSAGFPVFSGAYANDTAIFTRVYWDFDDKVTKVQTIRIGEDGKVSQSEEIVPLEGKKHGVHQACAAAPDGTLFLSTSTGALHVSRGGDTKYTREESLADIAGVHFIELGEPETEETLGLMADESFLGRVTRHITLLKDLPAYIVGFAQRLSSTADVASQTPPLTSSRLHRDQFGLQKIVVAVTRGGKAFGIDSANGNIVWSTNLGFFNEHGPELDVYATFATRNLSDHGNPQVGVIAVRERDNQAVTLGFHVDAYTGEVAGERDADFGVPLGKQIFVGRPRTAFLTQFVNCGSANRVIAVVDERDVLHIFPKCKKMAKQIAANPFFYTILDRALEGTTLRGYTPTSVREDLALDTTELWSRTFAAQEVLEVSPLQPSPIASYGRPLGDKSVLYKYLNPHLVVVTSVSPSTATGHVYVVDTATGASVYDVAIPGVVGKHVRAAMVENWLVYSWLEAGAGDNPGGWRIGSVELYEADASGDEKSAGRSSLAAIPRINAVAQTFIADSDMRALTFTTSKYGVATKDVVYVNDAGQVTAIPRRLLDPRRPLGKPSKADQEDMLIPYEAVLPFNPQAVLSHVYPVHGLRTLVASPAQLESTTLLLAYGLDLFGSRALQPSGNFDILGTGFAKMQLLLTLAALGAGVAVAAPTVARKVLKAKWF